LYTSNELSSFQTDMRTGFHCACDITFPSVSSQIKIIDIKNWFTNTVAQNVE